MKKGINVKVGDIVVLKKPHPCGGKDWEVVRLGMDAALRCNQCNHIVKIARSRFLKQIKSIGEKKPDIEI